MEAVARYPTPPWIEVLPKVKGRYKFMSPLNKVTWFRVGGNAEVVYRPANIEDLQFFLQNCPQEIPLTFMGVGSNLLCRDGGVPGVTIRLGTPFNHTYFEEDFLDVGAGALDRQVVDICLAHGLGNLEFLCGIPGTIGGNIRMNAGCYGQEIKDVLEWALAIDRAGTLHKIPNAACHFKYRRCGVPTDWIFVGARFKVSLQDPAVIKQKIEEMLSQREASQPIRARTGGSTFANPPGHKAWQLIDGAGCRGLTVGDAVMSEKHCNFMINQGQATASDLETLGEEVRQRVLATSGVQLEWEIQRIGRKNND